MSEFPVDAVPGAERVRAATDMGYFPVAAVTADGAVLVVFRAGAGHRGHAGYLASARSEDSGRTWTQPATVVRSQRYDDRNPALGVAQDGTVVVAYHANGRPYGKDDRALPAERRNPQAVHTGLVLSHDGGRTWSEPMLWTDQTEWDGMSPYGSILTLADGRMAMPVYRRTETGLLWSTDNGRSWGDLTIVAHDINETAYAVLRSGEWVLLGRSNDGHGQHSLLRWSWDEGRTWSEPTQFLTDRRLPSDLAVLPDGSLLAVHGYRTEPRGARARRSTDRGRTWSAVDLVLHDNAPTTDCGYPSVVVTDGWVVMFYYDAGKMPMDHYTAAGCFLEAVRVPVDELIEAFR